jgi:hypothetical protein
VAAGRALAGLLLVPLLTVGAPVLQAQEWSEFRSARQSHSVAESFALELVYGAGVLQIEPEAGDLLYDVRMTYDSRKFKPVRTWDLTEGRARLKVGLTTAGDGADWIEALSSGDVDDADFDPDLSFDLDDLGELDDSSGTLLLRLGRRLPTDLKLAIGAAKSEIELGGVALSRLEITTAASDTELSFSAPNPVRMGELVIRVGAAEIRTEGLGNARFDRFELKSGVGDVVLDFTGAWDGSATGVIRMGIGSLELRLPADLGVWIRKSSFLTSFDAPSFRNVDDGFRSPNWAGAEHRLELQIDTAFGAIDVELVP